MVSHITYLQSHRQWFMKEKRLADTCHHGAVYQIEKRAAYPGLAEWKKYHRIMLRE